MIRLMILFSLLFSTFLIADYATYQEAQQVQQIKSLYSKARDVAITLEQKYNQTLLENQALQKQIDELKAENEKLKAELAALKVKDSNSTTEVTHE